MSDETRQRPAGTGGQNRLDLTGEKFGHEGKCIECGAPATTWNRMGTGFVRVCFSHALRWRALP